MILNHAENMALVNAMQIYMNLDSSKCSQSTLRTQINVNLVNLAYEKIAEQYKSPKNENRVRII